MSALPTATGEPRKPLRSGRLRQRLAATGALTTLAQDLAGELAGHTISWLQDDTAAEFTWLPGNSQAVQCRVARAVPASITFSRASALDHSASATRIETLSGKSPWRDDKGRLHSRVFIAPSWRRETSLRFPVPNGSRDELIIGESRLVLLTRPGAFGWQWCESVRPAPPADATMGR